MSPLDTRSSFVRFNVARAARDAEWSRSGFTVLGSEGREKRGAPRPKIPPLIYGDGTLNIASNPLSGQDGGHPWSASLLGTSGESEFGGGSSVVQE